ncbi:MAG: alpha/beta fold hydrolase [Bacillota bacterium]|uniref:Alpha/beta fold hydrolase n=2 Tax=Virgibacillus TaxID=84406 RepID=A0A941IAC5_9BACI|nr:MULTISPECIES: alpha/beta fold hydrolase [Virgibacillus]MBR7797764.1 alpha/beta fold hydrolase [Virgibacillus salarius]MDY7046003.1 alpha/beta fold hydrolase [Virgibacillus sp. M23]NAZ10473.1 alpha/beta fold hydrolase [Agaribacter marinus]
MKKKHLMSIASICIVILGLIALVYMPNKTKSDFDKIRPTLFVHGYKGTVNSFGHMLKRFESDYNWGNKALVYFVKNNGAIEKYNLSKGKKEPVFVQVIFENNRASFEETAGWLAAVLADMKAVYSIENVNLVGHSMGGIVSLEYMKQYQGVKFPTVRKFIAIGSPFDGIYSEEYFQLNRDPAATDLHPDSPALQFLRERSFPEYTQVLSIGSTGDAIAVPESIKSLRTIIPKDQLEEVIIDDLHLSHSGLHESKLVDQYIYEFLWQDQIE